MNRRTLLALPFIAAVPAAARAAPTWRHDVSEIRYGGSDPATPTRARALQTLLGVPVRAVLLPPNALAEALDRGAVECAHLTQPARTRADTLMGPRLIHTAQGTIRRALPNALRADLTQALRSI